MKLDKLWNGLKRIANGDYVLEGDLISDETIDVDLDDRLVVRGSVISKKMIIVRCGIEAGWGIEAGEGIEAGCGIKAGSFIHAEKRIFAGVSVYHTSQNCKKIIQCSELRKGEICFGDLIITMSEPIKVVCTGYKKAERYFTIGKIYEWKDNTITSDRGFTYHGGLDNPTNVCGSDPEKWGLSTWYTFIKIVEE